MLIKKLNLILKSHRKCYQLLLESSKPEPEPEDLRFLRKSGAYFSGFTCNKKKI